MARRNSKAQCFSVTGLYCCRSHAPEVAKKSRFLSLLSSGPNILINLFVTPVIFILLQIMSRNKLFFLPCQNVGIKKKSCKNRIRVAETLKVLNSNKTHFVANGLVSQLLHNQRSQIFILIFTCFVFAHTHSVHAECTRFCVQHPTPHPPSRC